MAGALNRLAGHIREVAQDALSDSDETVSVSSRSFGTKTYITVVVDHDD